LFLRDRNDTRGPRIDTGGDNEEAKHRRTATADNRRKTKHLEKDEGNVLEEGNKLISRVLRGKKKTAKRRPLQKLASGFQGQKFIESRGTKVHVHPLVWVDDLGRIKQAGEEVHIKETSHWEGKSSVEEP